MAAALTYDDLAERAAVLEFDGGLSREEAEGQACREYLDQVAADPLARPGIYGELLEAFRFRLHPLFDDLERRLELGNIRAPMWGWDYISATGDTYSPTTGGTPAAIVQCTAPCGDLRDLVAHDLRTGRQHRRL